VSVHNLVDPNDRGEDLPLPLFDGIDEDGD
jgi:hypothetical protein